jgi:hypothetical protein
VNALLKPKGIQLKQLFREAEKRLSFAQAERMNVNVLQVMSIYLQDYCSPPYFTISCQGSAAHYGMLTDHSVVRS